MAVRVLVLSLLLIVLPLPVWAAEPLPRFEPAPCPAALPNRQVECGFLIVPEDRSQPNSPTIKIAVAVLKASDPNSQPDPILIINGGPGAEALSDLPRFVNTFAYLTADPQRDIIIFDQRGVGLSQPALGCPELAPLLEANAQGLSLEDSALSLAYETCRDHWLAQGDNLAAYTPSASAADINDLWRTLGYEQVNLYGVSYGTVVAQIVARNYPQGIRSIVLDSAYPLSIHLLTDSAANLHAAFSRLFTDCAADWACHSAYPDLPAIYTKTIEQLQRQPAPFTFIDPNTGTQISKVFTSTDFIDLLRQAPPSAVPALIYNIHDGDLSDITIQSRTALDMIRRYGPPPNRALVYSVMCSQAMYQVTPEQVRDTTYPESSWARRFIQWDLFPLPCNQWPHAEPDPKDSQPWTSDIPTLILHGANDNTLAPSYDALLAYTFQKGQTVSVPNVGHGVLTSSLCANTLARAFFNKPSQPLDTTCLNQSPFQLNFKYSARASVALWPVIALSGLLSLAVVWLGVRAAQFWQTHQFGFSLRHSGRLMGWVLPLAAIILSIIGLLGGLHVIGLEPIQTLATILVPIATLQAALLFSPEDEPGLEVALATPRPLAWTVLERWGLLVVVYSLRGLGLSLGATAITGEPIWVAVGRWLPSLIVLSALAITLTLILRRPILSLSLVSLIWFAAYFLGDTMIQVWPFAWPLHLYIQPDHLDFWLNRVWLTVAGLGLMGYASANLLNNEERLLLGDRPGRGKVATSQLEVIGSDQPILISVQPAAFQQILGLVRYEMLMQLRRPGLAVFGLCLLIIPVLNAVMGNAQLAGLQASVAAGNTSAEYAQTLVTNQVLPISWLGGLAASLIVIFIVVADTFPKDKQLGIYETLQSLPLTSTTYLIGKLLSVWVMVALAVLSAALLTTLLNWLRFGPFDIGLYLEMWLVGVGGLALINAALGVLLTATQPNNRRALLVGVGLAVLTLGLMAVGFISVQSGWSHWLLGRPALSLYYLVGYPNAFMGLTTNSGLSQAMGTLTSQSAALLDLAAGFCEVVIVAILMAVVLRRKTFG